MSDTSTRQRRLERLEEVLPSTVFLKWYKEDQITHSDEWHVDRENQVWYVITFSSPAIFQLTMLKRDLSGSNSRHTSYTSIELQTCLPWAVL